MAITDKTRKIIWGRSGNRCAICRNELIINSTPSDDESVVGDECHILARKNQGPRHLPDFSISQLDEPENLLLLCRVHHKMVDDQSDTYTVEELRRIKVDHEKWVSASLGNVPKDSPIRVRATKGTTLNHLVRILSGRELFEVVNGAFGYSFQHDEPKSKDEAELLAGFLQAAQDWGEISSDLGAGERVKASFGLSSLIRSLEDGGFWVFGGREIHSLEGGTGPTSPFPIAVLQVSRPSNPEIITIDLNGAMRISGNKSSSEGKYGTAKPSAPR